MVEHKALSLGDGGELNELIMQRNGKEWEWMERFKGVGVDEHRDQAEFLEGRSRGVGGYRVLVNRP